MFIKTNDRSAKTVKRDFIYDTMVYMVLSGAAEVESDFMLREAVKDLASIVEYYDPIEDLIKDIKIRYKELNN